MHDWSPRGRTWVSIDALCGDLASGFPLRGKDNHSIPLLVCKTQYSNLEDSPACLQRGRSSLRPHGGPAVQLWILDVLNGGSAFGSQASVQKPSQVYWTITFSSDSIRTVMTVIPRGSFPHPSQSIYCKLKTSQLKMPYIKYAFHTPCPPTTLAQQHSTLREWVVPSRVHGCLEASALCCNLVLQKVFYRMLLNHTHTHKVLTFVSRVYQVCHTFLPP